MQEQNIEVAPRQVGLALFRAVKTTAMAVNALVQVLGVERCLRHREGVWHVTPEWVLHTELALGAPDLRRSFALSERVHNLSVTDQFEAKSRRFNRSAYCVLILKTVSVCDRLIRMSDLAANYLFQNSALSKP